MQVCRRTDTGIGRFQQKTFSSMKHAGIDDRMIADYTLITANFYSVNRMVF